MVSSAFSRSVLVLAAGLLAPLFLTQCKTSVSSYKDVSYDPAKLKTPAGHGLDRNDYPFDESGAYRKDWVKNNTGGRDRSASPKVESSTVASTTTPSSTPSNASTSYPTYAEASAARAAGASVGSSSTETSSGTDASPTGGGVELASAGLETSPAPAPAPASAAPSYHKVSSGDTLFALAGKYHTSVPELKRVNGLSGDNIRVGQSLRLP
ncbi:MAG: LysM peptidoglycan-binding domain-containing protein [Verrucomicrobiaceae bacterium]|nr:LysM peptidoglycan-binding domain-containing protein [Verrucomicrobiaceae bacterium]